MKKKLFTLGLVTTFTFMGFTIPSYTYADDNLKELREERSEIKEKLSDADEKIVDMMDEAKELNAELSILEQSLKKNNQQREEVEKEIEEVAEDIETLQKKIDERFKILGDRAKSYQESGGNLSFLEVILGSKDFTDFISRVNAVSQITDSDAEIIKQQEKEQAEVEEKLVGLEELEQELKEMGELISEQKETAEEMKKTLNKKEKRLKKSIKQLKKKDRTLAEKEAEMFAEENVEIVNVANDRTLLGWPTEGGYISSTFGKRWGRQHKGIDIARTDRSTSPPIAAAESGTVEQAGNSNNGYGNMVLISHGDGLKTLYAHMSSLDVKVGQTVERGQKIGVMGRTGNSTGIHLHFEVHKDGTAINPTPYLR